jgi:hypothetical protein
VQTGVAISLFKPAVRSLFVADLLGNRESLECVGRFLPRRTGEWLKTALVCGSEASKWRGRNRFGVPHRVHIGKC